MRLLGGIEGKVVRGGMEREEEQEEKELEWEEVTKVIERLKDKKAIGMDGIPSEMWKYGGEEMRRWA